MFTDLVYRISSPQSDGELLAALVARAKLGDNAAFGQLYDLTFEKIYRFIFYRVGHKEVAEDLTEEVFLKVYEGLQSLHSHGSFEGWLYRIARHRVIDYYRSKKALIPLDEVENTLEYETNVVDLVNLQNQQKIFLKLLKELAPEQQIVIKLKFFDDLANTEIAELLHKNEGAIRVIQHRALTKLKTLWAKQNANNHANDE
jgi:RNA polymerase sigma-70 factor (ECF subfamily)